jgi:hypothetical protein
MQKYSYSIRIVFRLFGSQRGEVLFTMSSMISETMESVNAGMLDMGGDHYLRKTWCDTVELDIDRPASCLCQEGVEVQDWRWGLGIELAWGDVGTAKWDDLDIQHECREEWRGEVPKEGSGPVSMD